MYDEQAWNERMTGAGSIPVPMWVAMLGAAVFLVLVAVNMIAVRGTWRARRQLRELSG